MKKIITFLLLLILSIVSKAQIEEEEDWYDESYNNNYEGAFNIFLLLNLDYGLANYSIKPQISSFNNRGAITINFGTATRSFDGNSSLLIFNKMRFSIANDILGKSENESKIDINSFQFNAGFYLSLGYNSENLKIYPYYSIPMNMSWSKIKVNRYPISIPNNEKDYIKDIETSIRYGTLREIGLLFFIKDKYLINLNYENQIIYPRHLLLTDFLSQSLELLCSFALLTPISALDDPYNKNKTGLIIANFLLQTALSYGYTKLRQDKIYWPFNSNPGLSIQQFKLGFGISIR